MSTHQPPKWNIVFEDQTSFSSDDGPWSDVAFPTFIGGMQVYLTHKGVAYLTLTREDGTHMGLDPLYGTPFPFFAFKRLQTRVLPIDEDSSEWLYSCFGYITDTHTRLNLYLYADGDSHIQVTPIDAPFL